MNVGKIAFLESNEKKPNVFGRSIHYTCAYKDFLTIDMWHFVLHKRDSHSP